MKKTIIQTQTKTEINKFKKQFIQEKKLRDDNSTCCYCDQKMADVRKLVYYQTEIKDADNKVIKIVDSSRGGKRGKRLEVERENPNDTYNTNNCKPACYLCNNAKSNLPFTFEEFRKTIGKGIGEAVKAFNEKLK